MHPNPGSGIGTCALDAPASSRAFIFVDYGLLKQGEMEAKDTGDKGKRFEGRPTRPKPLYVLALNWGGFPRRTAVASAPVPRWLPRFPFLFI